MRLIAVLLLALPVVAQDTFHDADFEFSITPPAGMQLVSPEDLAAMFRRPVEQFTSVPRAESPDGVALHESKWRDTTGHSREMTLTLKDRVEGEEPIMANLDAWAAATEAAFGVTIEPDDRELIRRGPLVIGFRVTANRVRADGAQLRHTFCYLPLLVNHPTERDRTAIVQLQALEADWDDYAPDFDAVIESIEFPLPRVGGGPAAAGGVIPGAPAAGGGGGGGGRAGGARRAKGEGWGSLQVTGSLLLALVLLGSLFVGGAGKASAGA